MGSDRIVPDHPEKRRRPRLIRAIDPEIRRELKRVIDQFPQELHVQLDRLADEARVSNISVMLYALACHMLEQPRAELMRVIRELHPDASDAQIGRAFAGFKKSLNAEIRANRRMTRD